MLDQKYQTYPLVQVNGKLALFTNTRIKHDEIPEGLYRAQIRGNDNNGEPCNIEPYVAVNYGGTVMFREEITYTHGTSSKPYIPIDEHGLTFFGVQVTISGFLNHSTEYSSNPESEESATSDLEAWKMAHCCALSDCPEGLFMFLRDGRYSLGFKSEYTADNGLVEAYCFTTGEMFWGGAKTPDRQRELTVYPLADHALAEKTIIAHILKKFNLDNLTRRGGLPITIHNQDEAVQFIRDAQRNAVYCWEKSWNNGDTCGSVSGAFIISVTDQLRIYALNAAGDGGFGGAAGLCEFPLGALVEDLIGATVNYASINM